VSAKVGKRFEGYPRYPPNWDHLLKLAGSFPPSAGHQGGDRPTWMSSHCEGETSDYHLVVSSCESLIVFSTQRAANPILFSRKSKPTQFRRDSSRGASSVEGPPWCMIHSLLHPLPVPPVVYFDSCALALLALEFSPPLLNQFLVFDRTQCLDPERFVAIVDDTAPSPCILCAAELHGGPP
jgi:hypothetical protein